MLIFFNKSKFISINDNKVFNSLPKSGRYRGITKRMIIIDLLTVSQIFNDTSLGKILKKF